MGEVPYSAMADILDKIHELRMELDPHHTSDEPFRDDVFIDLGSGAGGLVSPPPQVTNSRRV